METMPIKPMLLREFWGFDPDGWLVSEKLDGVRVIWDGRNLWTREGNKVSAPQWFLSDLPNACLDCELYGGIGTLPIANGISRSKNADDQKWHGFKLHVFDAPLAAGTASERIQFASDLVSGCRFATGVPHAFMASRKAVDDLLQTVLARGGEGLVLRHAASPYQSGRSFHALKYKSKI